MNNDKWLEQGLGRNSSSAPVFSFQGKLKPEPAPFPVFNLRQADDSNDVNRLHVRGGGGHSGNVEITQSIYICRIGACKKKKKEKFPWVILTGEGARWKA